MSNIMKGRYKGENNPQYGTRWMHDANIGITKKVKSDEVESHLENGWVFGKLKINCDKCDTLVCSTDMYRHNCHQCPICMEYKLFTGKFCSAKCADKSREIVEWGEYDLLEMKRNGLSTRAIANIIGCSNVTIAKRIRKLENTNVCSSNT